MIPLQYLKLHFVDMYSMQLYMFIDACKHLKLLGTAGSNMIITLLLQVQDLYGHRTCTVLYQVL